MADGVDEVAGAFATEIAPASRPRDTQGKFVQETRAPEHILQERPVEGDPLTGDTSDGGDDPAFAAREREIADGYEGTRRSPAENEGSDRQRRRADRAPQPDNADADDGYDVSDREPENISAESEQDATDEDAVQDEDGGSRYEVTVDGEKFEVSLNEALNGYIRQATFHQRMAQVHEATRELEAEHGRLQQGWAMWNKARLGYEEDVANMLPKEPNWDDEFAKDPHAAHYKQKTFQTIYANLARSQQLRFDRDAVEAEERDRRVQKYAVDGFSKFVMDHIKVMPDEPTLRRNIQSMRRTGIAAGFSEYEIATVYDPRMLNILLKASKYDRMMANSAQGHHTG